MLGLNWGSVARGLTFLLMVPMTSATLSSVAEAASDVAEACVDGRFSATNVPIVIPDNNARGVTSTMAVTGDGVVDSLALTLTIRHPFRGDLRVVLISPAGTQHLVHNRTGGSADDLVLNSVDVQQFIGEPAAGPWRLVVSDHASIDVGTLVSWSLDLSSDCDVDAGGWFGSATPNLATVDNDRACTSLTVSGGGNAADVRLSIEGEHDFRLILRGTLTHNGTTVEAFPARTFPGGKGAFSFTDRAVPGLSGSATGVWTLCIIDTDAFSDTGVLRSWSIHD